MMPRLCITCLFLLFISSTARANDEIKRTAELILSKLYHAHGNHQVAMPGIKIVNHKGGGAMYRKDNNSIELDIDLYRICENIGTDALAFVLGHELVHAFQEGLEAGSTSFLAQEHAHANGKEVEETADVHGLFITYLAGYTRAGEYLPELMEQIYSSYKLSPDLPDYPSLAERQSTLAKARAQAQQLTRLHEAGIYLMAANQYALAIECFEFIKAYYEGQEIFNNLGIAYALQALHFTRKITTPYLFPLEASWETRMRDVRSGELDAQEQEQMQGYLHHSSIYLGRASRMNPAHLPAHTNLMCVMVLGGQAGTALHYSDEHGLSALSAIPAARQRWQLALALAHAHDGQTEAALHTWQELETTGGMIAAQAKFNCNIHMKVDTEPPGQGFCTRIPEEVLEPRDGVNLRNCDTSNDIFAILPDKKTRLWLTETSSSQVYCFLFQNRSINLQAIANTLPQSFSGAVPTNLLTDQGALLHCPDEKLVVRLDTEGSVLGWVKYFVEK